MSKSKTVVAGLIIAALGSASGAIMAQPSTSEISENVKAAIRMERIRKPSDINVQIKDGVVIMSGWAYSDTERQRAVRAAMKVHGVSTVMAQGVRFWSSRSYDYY